MAARALRRLRRSNRHIRSPQPFLLPSRPLPDRAPSPWSHPLPGGRPSLDSRIRTPVGRGGRRRPGSTYELVSAPGVRSDPCRPPGWDRTVKARPSRGALSLRRSIWESSKGSGEFLVRPESWSEKKSSGSRDVSPCHMGLSSGSHDTRDLGHVISGGRVATRLPRERAR